MTRIAFIGAGSFGFTRQLALDVLMVPELVDTDFVLHDIDEVALGRMAQILRREIEANGLPATITTELDRAAALDGANYIISAVRIGGLDAFRGDIEIPLKYGIDQCIGDTLCAGGIMYGQRNVPQMESFQADAKRYAADHCLFLNYANPMAMNTWSALDAFDDGQGVETIGLCHGVENTWQQVAAALAHYHGDDVDLDAPAWHRQLVQVVAAGINHQTWMIDVSYRGRPVNGEELLAAFEAHPTLPRTEPVRVDVLRRFGYYSTESNGHLSEYVPWYRKNLRREPALADRWISPDKWINGETGGYLRVFTEGQQLFDADFERLLAEAGRPMSTWQRSSEHGSYIIEARETGRAYRGHFNVRNRGIITNLPDDCIVESLGFVDDSGLSMRAGIELPLACAATCLSSINVQRMAVRAAQRGDVLLLKQAMLHDPLSGAVAEPEQLWQLADEMLVAQRAWLPNYSAAAIDAAAMRLRAHEAAGTRVPMVDWSGSTRRPIRALDEVRVDEHSLLAADKA